MAAHQDKSRTSHEEKNYGAIEGDVRVEPSGGDEGKCSPCGQRLYPEGFWPELKVLMYIAWPMVATQLCQYTFGPIAIIFCGHLGKTELDAVALSNSMINVTGVSIAVGLSSACDTLFSQTFGSKNKHKLGVVLQRSLLIIGIAIFPCYALHLNMEPILVLLGQEPEVARLSGEYMLIFIPGMASFFIYISLGKYLQNQNIIYPNLLIGAFSNGINAIMHYVLLFVYDYGTVGSAISQTVGYCSMCIITILYIIIFKKHKETWSGWSMECLQDWGMFFRLAILGMLMICIEWWSFEVGILLTGTLGTTQLGAQSVVFQMETLAYMFPLGVGVSASIRVGHNLGAGNYEGAKTSARVAITFIAGIGLFIGIMFASLRQYWPMIFTNVPEVVDMAANVLPILGFYMTFDSIAGVCGGILRGSGRQHIGAMMVTVGYIIGLSTGIPLMFLTTLEISGFWMGLAGALLLEASVYTYLIWIATDWQKEVVKATERTVHNSDACIDDNEERVSEEKDALLENSAGSTDLWRPPLRRYSSQYTEPYPTKPVLSQPPLPIGVVIWRRILTFLVLFSIFIAGLLVRLFVDTTSPDNAIYCVPLGQTSPPGVTLPPCNSSSTSGPEFLGLSVGK